jgi:hypothetical protein
MAPPVVFGFYKGMASGYAKVGGSGGRQ